VSFAGRSAVSLDGRWQLQLVDVPRQRGPAQLDVVVPGSWTLQVPGAELADGTVRYARTFALPSSWPADGHVVLRFGAVNHSAEVRVNGSLLGEHQGGWMPFELPLDRALLRGEDDLLEVVVTYPPLLARSPGSVGLQEVPHGKQTWYGTNAGIWQSVVLEHRPAHHLSIAQVRADAGSGRVSARVTVVGRGAPGSAVQLAVRDRGSVGAGVVVARSARTPLDGEVPDPVVVELAATVERPELWSPAAPALYDVVVELVDADDGVHDALVVQTGFRTVTTKDGQVLLNGQPIELRGVLDQDYHPGGELRAASVEELERLFTEVKRLGFNLLRCHIRRPDPVYFEVADRLGLMVWAELPSWQRFTARSAAAAQALLRQMIEVDGHHPSIVCWSVVNESWGIDLSDPEQRAWLVRTQSEAKDLAPDTLVVDNSACDPNFHVRSDLEDFHVYRGVPERRREWDAWVEEFVQHPHWTYSPYGDAERTGDEPLVVSEFGNWGLPDILALAGPDGTDPWWAAPGRDWAFGAAEATDVVGRFRKLGLEEVFGSWPAFVEATQRQQLLATRYQIGSLRRRPQIAGYVLTQLSDVQWEANGLFDMDRRPRLFVEELALVNGPAAVVLRPESYAGVAGTRCVLTVDVVAPAGHAGQAGHWTIALRVDDGEQQVRAVPAGVRSTVTAEVELPREQTVCRVQAELHVDGRLAGRDVADLAVLAPPRPRAAGVVAADDELGRWLQSLEVPVVREPDGATLLVTRCFEAEAQAHARSGGRVLVLAEDRAALADAFRAPLLARLSPREGDGDWVPRFDWLRRDGAFGALPGGPLLDLAYEDVIGELVIDFLPAPLRPAHLHSAVFAGWLQHRASTTVTVPWSAGAVTITTLRLRAPGAAHPLAAALARAMLDAAEQ